MSFTISGIHPVSFQGGTFNSIAGDFKVFSTGTLCPSGPNGSDCGCNSRRSDVSGGPRDSRRMRKHANYPNDGEAERAENYHVPRPSGVGLGPSPQDASSTTPSPGANLCSTRLLERPPELHSNSTFNTVGGNMTNLSFTSYGENGLDLLYRSVVKDALHNSAERPPDPSCHPGTRDAVLDRLREWSRDNRSAGTLLWLHGSAGVGKSAIAQNFAADCHERGELGASFFFHRGHPGRGTWKYVFPTLAYQLAASFPDTRGKIQQAVETDRLVVGQAMRLQFQKLIVEPFEQAPSLTVWPIIVIDGLDECQNHDAQIMLLKLFLEALRGNRLRARVVISSRPEAHLREVLGAADNCDVCIPLELLPDVSAYADIHQYFCDEFLRIRDAHASRGTILGDDWPSEDVIEHLVEKSSGTFIYASTVLRYVDDEYSHPAERLDAVLRLDPQSTAPLDDLYTQILSAFPNQPLLRRVLHAIILTDGDLLPEEIDSVLQVRGGTSRSALRGLHSLLFVPPARTIGFRYLVALLHSSFSDFLLDPARSSVFCVAIPSLHAEILRGMISILTTGPVEPLLFRSIATALLHCIVQVPPTDDLFPVLQNVDVQQAGFLSATCTCQISDWLKRSPEPPLDLIQMWEDLHFISSFQEHMRRDLPLDDSDYASIFARISSHSPYLLTALRIFMVWPQKPTFTPVLDLLGLTWEILRPLCVFRACLESDSASGGNAYGNSLIDYLCNPLRAGALYVSRQDTLRCTALRCIAHIKEILVTNSFFEFDPTWFFMIAQCEPCDSVLCALEDLDVAQSCGRLDRDPEYHAACHEDFLHPSCFVEILDWLGSFPCPPLEIIEFWEQQRDAVEKCWESLLSHSSGRGNSPDVE
ncbi:hypothetical protein C8R44DRAFT_196327 [Mycena epipterygia]|nr:hypothetical protein C8R44DRAFT_196327 [Mycena epipterygia]